MRRGIRVKAFVIVSLALYAVQPVFPARAEKSIFIVSFTGGTVTLIREGREHRFLHPSDIPKGGIQLQEADTVQTAAGVFAELQVKPGRVSVHIAENTSLVVENIKNSGNILVFSLVYGRVRAVQKGRANTILVKAGLSIVEMQKGNVNIDNIIVPDVPYESQPVIYISTLSGTAVFIPSFTDQPTERIKLNKKETFIFYTGEGRFERWIMNKDI
ncbi:MAG: hypothetical protein LBP37_03135, partial [Spirochaetaceae bacterium]|nr:hypothetical protein [Spirochaetaceae bacterium]